MKKESLLFYVFLTIALCVGGWLVVAGTAAMVTRTRASAAAPLIHRGTEPQLLGWATISAARQLGNMESVQLKEKTFSVLSYPPHKL